jgi:site-specific DNA recombinase
MSKTPAAPTTVGIYARISDARDGDTEGTDRQVAMCREHAARHGMEVVGVYVDNNRSAYQPKGKRPEYDRILNDLEAGHFEAILVVATDRLYRQMKDLEALVTRLGGDRHGKPVYTIKSGDVDLSTADGRLNARLLGAVAMHSSEKASERVRDAVIDRVRRGRFNGGSRRFGYNEDMTELVEEEAAGVRWAYEFVDAGGSIKAAARELSKRGLKGTKGGPMDHLLVWDILRRPANGGFVAYKGVLQVGVESLAPKIVDTELWERVNLILRDPSRRRPKGRNPKSLLSGILVCGKCGARLYYRTYRPDLQLRDAYRCVGKGCCKREAKVVEDAVVSYIGKFLRERKAVVVLPKKYAKGDESLPAKAEKLRKELEENQLWYNTDKIDLGEWKANRDVARAKLDAVLARMEALTPSSTPALNALMKADQPEEVFLELDVDGKRAVIKELVAGIAMEPVGRGRGGDPVLLYQWNDGILQR